MQRCCRRLDTMGRIVGLERATGMMLPSFPHRQSSMTSKLMASMPNFLSLDASIPGRIVGLERAAGILAPSLEMPSLPAIPALLREAQKSSPLAVTPNTLSGLLSSLHNHVEEHGKLDRTTVEAALEDYTGTDYQEYVVRDHKVGYTRTIVELNPAFTVLVLTWNPGYCSAIHSHGGSECSLKVMKATETREEVFAVHRSDAAPHGQIDPIQFKLGASEEGQVGYISDKIGAHRVCNKDTVPSVTINIYYPPYDECTIFDPDTGVGTRIETNMLTQAKKQEDELFE